jgi:hypothetical protein
MLNSPTRNEKLQGNEETTTKTTKTTKLQFKVESRERSK